LRDRLQLGAELGRGSYGVVHRVSDAATGQDLALKVIELQADGEREFRELRAHLMIEHPRIVRCFEAEVHEGRAFLLLELATCDLGVLVRGANKVRAPMMALCDAVEGVAALHQAGLIHRDLKPGNILVTDAGGKVSDLGLAKGGELKTLTRQGILLGTPQFMSPEQARGDRLTTASDVYSLGILAHFCLLRQLPLPELPVPELLAHVARGERLRFRESDSWIPAATRRLVEAALEPDPASRPTDLAAWGAELREVDLPELRAVASPTRTLRPPPTELAARTLGTSPLPTSPRPPGSRRGAWWALVVLALAGVAAGAWWNRARLARDLAVHREVQARARARFLEAVEELRRDPEVRDAVGLHGEERTPEVLATWRAGRDSYRRLARARGLRELIGTLVSAGPDRELNNAAVELATFTHLLGANLLHDEPPLWRSEEAPDPSPLLAQGVEAREVRVLRGFQEGDRKARVEGVRALLRDLPGEWVPVRRLEDLVTLEDGEPVIVGGQPRITALFRVHNYDGLPFVDPRKGVSKLIQMSMRDEASYRFDDLLPEHCRFPLEPVGGRDLELVILCYSWPPTHFMRLRLSGEDDDLLVLPDVPTMKVTTYGDDERVGIHVRVPAALVPEGLEGAEIEAMGVQAVTSNIFRVGVEEVLQRRGH
jgi:hypothetical protein